MIIRKVFFFSIRMISILSFKAWVRITPSPSWLGRQNTFIGKAKNITAPNKLVRARPLKSLVGPRGLGSAAARALTHIALARKPFWNPSCRVCRFARSGNLAYKRPLGASYSGRGHVIRISRHRGGLKNIFKGIW